MLNFNFCHHSQFITYNIIMMIKDERTNEKFINIKQGNKLPVCVKNALHHHSRTM